MAPALVKPARIKAGKRSAEARRARVGPDGDIMACVRGEGGGRPTFWQWLEKARARDQAAKEEDGKAGVAKRRMAGIAPADPN